MRQENVTGRPTTAAISRAQRQAPEEFAEGQRCYHTGWKEIQNPHNTNTPEGRAWLTGYRLAKVETEVG